MQIKKTSRKEKQLNPPRQTSAKAVPQKTQMLLLPGLIVALTAFVLYANTLGHGYTLDDYSVILENRLTKQGASAIPEIFTTSYRYGYYFSDDNLYRPLVKAMFALEWEWSPNDPFAGHLVNVLLFALTGFILFRFLLLISSGSVLFAFLASLLFVAHPVHTEVVASIKSRDEILALLFGILAVERYLLYLKNQKVISIIAAALFLFAGLLSKESAITFLAVFPLAGWFFTGSAPMQLIRSSMPMIGAAGIFLFIRAAVLHGILPDSVSLADNHLMGAKNPATWLASAVHVLGLYLKILIFPHPLAFDYSFNQIPLVGPGNWKFLLSALAYLGIFGFSIYKFKSKDPVSFSILFYLITLSVSSNLFMTIGSGMGERFLYAPSLGFVLALTYLIFKLLPAGESGSRSGIWNQLKSSPALLTVFTLFFVGYSAKLIARNPVWKDNYTLYSSDVLISPNSTRTHYYLGNYLVKPEAWEGKGEEVKRATLYQGIESLKRSIEIYSGFSDAHTQMGVAYYKLNNLDSALICYRKALVLNPQNSTVQNNIGTVYFSQKQFEESLRYFTEATRLNPAYAEAHMNTGSAYGMMQQYDKALESLHQSVRYDPNNAQSFYFLGLTYRFKGDEANAGIYLEKAYQLDPNLRPKK